ncbi:MAG: hypothetical protein MUO63_14565 [Desulfobulbaceae bacterium]|nr:hypothetical protein [Desulfobulbaceae bacterium]
MMMKRWVSLLFPLVLCTNAAGVCAGEITFQSGLRYDWWKGNNDTDGNQVFVPVELGAEMDDFSARVITAFTRTESDISGVGNPSLSSVIDTKVNLSYVVVDKLPVNFLFGLDLNCPTGETDLDDDDLLIIRDPDLVSIIDHGEGFNVNPNVSMTKEWLTWGAGLGAGFLWRGEYDYSREYRNYDPGDIAYITGEIRYYMAEDGLVRLYGDYGTFSKDKRDDDDFYRESDFFLVGAETRYLTDNWETRFNVKGTFRGKSEFRQTSSKLKTESREGYGDEYVADLLLRYHFSEKDSIAPFVQLLYVDDNQYDESSPLYIGSRKKYSLGFSVKRNVSAAGNLELMFRFFHLDDEKGWLDDDDVTYRGHSLMLLYAGSF